MQAVREGVKAIVVDAPKQGLMSKLFARGAPPVPLSRHVVELVTSREVGRVYNLAPATIAMPPPMTAAAALANAAGSKPLYLFGWPFPVPAIDGIEEEADVAADFAADRLPAENFDQWRDVLATAVAAEKATHTYPVTTLVDSTGQLPQRVYLRTTPCELAIVSMEDKDLCYAALPYNDLVKWDCPVEAEIHVTARTRARLVAKPDRSGFSSQRPTRSTCHFVFKCTQAKAIISVIDNHLRALAKQLSNLGDGADEAEVAAAALSEVSLADEDEPAAAPAKAEEAKSIAKKPAPAPSSKRAVADDDDEDEAPKKSSKSKSSSRSRDDDEDEAPKKSVRGACCPSACRRCLSIACPRIPPSPTSSYARRPTPTTPPPCARTPQSKKRADSDEEEEEKPVKKVRFQWAAAAAVLSRCRAISCMPCLMLTPALPPCHHAQSKSSRSRDDDDDDEPVKKSSRSKSSKAAKADSDEEEEAPKKSSKKSSRRVSDDSD